MQKLFAFIFLCLLLIPGNKLYAQDIRFKKAIKNIKCQVSAMAQDKQGFLWLATWDQGLKRYDGTNIKTYISDQRNPHSIAGNAIITIFIDSENMIWLGMLGTGLDKFDPATNTFTHYRHDPKNASGLSADTVGSIVEDHLGNFWIGTVGGLDVLDRKTGKFSHYRNNPNDPSSLSNNHAFKILEDKNGEIWVGCWPLGSERSPENGGLNRFNRKTGKFTRYMHDPKNAGSIGENWITNLYEDKAGNFWIGSFTSCLYNMDRKTGTFTRYYPDPLSRTPLAQTAAVKNTFPFITFISEDITGALWIGLAGSGMNRYDPVSKNAMHFGPVYEGDNLLSAKDSSGFNYRNITSAFNSKDGLFWISTIEGDVLNLDHQKTTVPFYDMQQQEANAFYCEDNNNILWIGTASGLLRRDLSTRSEKLWTHDPKNDNSLGAVKVSAIRVDKQGIFWLGTKEGLDKFDPLTGKFKHYKHDPKDSLSLSCNNIYYLFIDHDQHVWITSDSGVSRMDKNTGAFTHYKKNSVPGPGLFRNYVLCVAEDKENAIWLATDIGVTRLDSKTGIFRNYIGDNFIKTICIDSKGITWAGGDLALYYYDKAKDDFVLFANEQSPVEINNIINVIEDDKKNLWVSTGSSIVKINEDRKRIKKYTDANGVRYSIFLYNDNFKGKDGRLFLGELYGYYAFYPDQLNDSSIAPQLIFSAFKLKDNEIKPGQDALLNAPIWNTEEIKLGYDQNVFSFDFFAIDYISPGDEKYYFMLENYDDTWHDIGSDHRASFFNIPPGAYHLRIKAISGDGASVEKSIRIIISPPWWKTWWAYIFYALLLIIVGYLIYKYQKHHILKKEREKAQQKELVQAKEIEKAYTELKTTQAQLIQSEKMASLGELTAGIAHEIQNPLNFVNNFSEVNVELSDEIAGEAAKGNLEEVKNLAKDIKENSEKINHHGKRADSIVKGMLQHSRSSSGQKEPTDINALADEYLRLAYHGLRAKDTSFNATMKTDFDESIGNINIVPQDIGRVILNLITNAFYVVAEKKKQYGNNYEPTVSVSTKSFSSPSGGRGVNIIVSDNGNGIPKNILAKIFQPFFTTKPTGQGTGLGLSLSYDIVKAHGGELKVETKENEGSYFTIQLPINHNA